MSAVRFTRVIDGKAIYIWPAEAVSVRLTVPDPQEPQGTLIVTTAAGSDSRVVVQEDIATVVALIDGVNPPAGSTFDATRNASGLFTFSNGNLTATQGGPPGQVTNPPAFTTLFHDSGVWVFRFTLDASETIGSSQVAFGLATADASSNAGMWLGSDTNSVGIYDNGNVYIGSAIVGNINGYKVGDEVDIVVDLTNETIADSINGGPLSVPVEIGALPSLTLSPALSGDQSGFQATFNGNPPVSIPGASPWG